MPNPSEDTALPALIYCRVSKKPRAGSASFESQRVLCSAHAERLGYTVSRVTQEVFSGAELFGRPKLARDRDDIRSGLFRALVAYSVDRLTRNEAHLAIIAAECERAGCRLIFVAEDDAAGRADEAYAAGVERSKVVERMHRGRRFHLSQGRPAFTGWDLYGYRRDREAGAYRVHEPEADNGPPRLRDVCRRVRHAPHHRDLHPRGHARRPHPVRRVCGRGRRCGSGRG